MGPGDEDKLREAQYSIADRHITPLKVFSLGDPQGEWIPDQDDIDSLASTLAAGQDDPNFALIGNFSLKVEYHGSTGKVLPVIPEFEFVEKRILTALFTNKAITHGEGPCATPDHRVLTPEGWKHYWEVGDDPIGTYNPDTNELEFQQPKALLVKDFDGEVVHFDHGWLEHIVTPDHRCLVNPPGKDLETWEVCRADEVEVSSRMPNTFQWKGKVPSEVVPIIPKQVGSGPRAKEFEVPLDDYLEFLGYMISEGSFEFSSQYKTGSPDLPGKRVQGLRIAQAVGSPAFDKMQACMERLPFNVVEKQFPSNKHRKQASVSWNCTQRGPSKHFFDAVSWTPIEGEHGASKRIPRWTLQLPVEKLLILAEALMAGDGNKREEGLRWEYYTKTKELAEDVLELFLKLGFPSKIRKQAYANGSGCTMYRVVARSDVSRTTSSTRNPKVHNITKEPYTGKVFCFEVPNRFYLYEYHGKVCISHNTYANASVAFEILQMRYAALRNLFDMWVREKVAMPIAEARGYRKITQAELNHKVRTSSGKSYHKYSASARRREGLQIPEIHWLEQLSLYDDTQKKNYMLRLRDKGDIPLKLLCEVFDWDYAEITRDLTNEVGTVADPVYRQTLQRVFTSYMAGPAQARGVPGGGPLLQGIPNVGPSPLGSPGGLPGGAMPGSSPGGIGEPTLPGVGEPGAQGPGIAGPSGLQTLPPIGSSKEGEEPEVPSDPVAVKELVSKLVDEASSLREALRETTASTSTRRKKVFGPSKYGKSKDGSVFYTNESAIEDLASKGGNSDGVRQESQGQGEENSTAETSEGSDGERSGGAE